MYEINLQIWLDPEVFEKLKEIKTRGRTWKEFLVDPILNPSTIKGNNGETNNK